MRIWLPAIFVIFLVSSCAVSRTYNATRKYSPAELQQDYNTFREVLEESHPSLYWYTPRDSMDFHFEVGRSKLTDSMTESSFRNVLSYVVSKIRCGHTSVRPSPEASRYVDSHARRRLFPLAVKIWNDTVLVTSNLNRRDSLVKRGVLLTAIEGRPVKQLIDSFFSHLSADGYNTTHKYQTLSNSGVFRNMYGSFYGLKPRMQVEFIDTTGQLRTGQISLYNPAADTPRVRPPVPARKPSRRERKKAALNSVRSLRIDTATRTAIMDLNTFTKHNGLRRFFRRSFRKMKEENIPNLVIDLRANGGGSVTLSNLLTKYIADRPFKIADSLYAISNRSRFGRFQSDYFVNRLFFIFMTRKKKDGNYHFSLYENKYFKPRINNRYDGTVYILTGGNTFSAATLVAQSLKPQENVIIVGEETGGGAYGNTAWLIPEMTLPNTRVRFRLPLFRLVINKEEIKGYGVTPEAPALPTVRDIRRNADFKMEKVRQLIAEGRERN
jgi:hypothetical protein